MVTLTTKVQTIRKVIQGGGAKYKKNHARENRLKQIHAQGVAQKKVNKPINFKRSQTQIP